MSRLAELLVVGWLAGIAAVTVGDAHAQQTTSKTPVKLGLGRRRCRRKSRPGTRMFGRMEWAFLSVRAR